MEAYSFKLTGSNFFTLLDVFQMSKTFCRDFLTLLLKDIKTSGHFGRTEVLTKALQKVIYALLPPI